MRHAATRPARSPALLSAPAGLLALLAALLLAGLLTGSPAAAAERILSFNANVEVARDGRLTVTETIRVRAEGNQIRRGIYRDIPLAFETESGRIARAGFAFVSAERDGRPEPFRVNTGERGVRIYLGAEDVFLRPGDYTYRLVYETTRQIRFFDDADEVYWNATGNEWAFPIDRATARVVLPEGVTATATAVYTGAYGEDGEDATIREEDGGRSVVFVATRPFAPLEGMSVAVAMPLGTIERPSARQELLWALSDRRVEILTGFGLALVTIYYLFAWWSVGRDPPAGVVFPRFEAPDGISPALAAYVADKGFSGGGWRALSAACLSLAVKGRLALSDFADDLTLDLGPKAQDRDPPLPKGEQAVMAFMTARGDPLTLSQANGVSVQMLGSAFRSALEGENRNRYYRANRVWMVPGVALSALTIFALIAFGNLSETQIVMLAPLFIVSVFLVIVSVKIGQAVRSRGSIALRIVVALLVFLVTVAGQLIGAAALLSEIDGPPLLPLIAIALFSVNLLFGWLIGAPTALGRKVMDEIAGLKMYLEVAEQERMNMAGAPAMSPAHFETLLPYAVALKVEKPWSQAFQAWLATAAGAAAAASYHPGFYSGSHFDRSDIAGSFADTMGGMAGTFSSSLPAPKSSSSGSGGGGFSGGGGGGGGGGGW